MKLSKKLTRKLLRQMYLIRAFEEQADQSYIEGKVHGTIHVSIGQEASSVGSISTLNPDDYILSTHRGHGHCIAKEADPKLMMAELFGKESAAGGVVRCTSLMWKGATWGQMASLAAATQWLLALVLD